MGEIQRNSIDRLLDNFFCLGCLEDKPLSEQSPDPRYCKPCCQFLLKEARLIEGKRHPSWIPSVINSKPFSKRVEQARDCNKIPTSVSDRVNGKRGRKRIDIPTEIIDRLTKEGMSCRRISERLKSDYGIECSFMTVARVIKTREVSVPYREIEAYQQG